MTIEEVLRKLQQRYGDNWPREALWRSSDLYVKDTLTRNERREFHLLTDWILEMIEAGIAFKQSQEQQ